MGKIAKRLLIGFIFLGLSGAARAEVVAVQETSRFCEGHIGQEGVDEEEIVASLRALFEQARVQCHDSEIVTIVPETLKKIGSTFSWGDVHCAFYRNETYGADFNCPKPQPLPEF